MLTRHQTSADNRSFWKYIITPDCPVEPLNLNKNSTNIYHGLGKKVFLAEIQMTWAVEMWICKTRPDCLAQASANEMSSSCCRGNWHKFILFYPIVCWVSRLKRKHEVKSWMLSTQLTWSTSFRSGGSKSPENSELSIFAEVHVTQAGDVRLRGRSWMMSPHF